MKTRLLIIIGILTIFSISILFTTEPAYALCIPSSDWPDRPCYGCRGCDPGLQQEKLDWGPYYDFKGVEWMDAKKQQLKNIIQNNSLDLWYQQTDGDANHNAHRYYFLQGEVRDRYGYNFEETLEFENAWNAVENNSKYAPILLWNYHDVILEGTIIETDFVQMISGEDVPLHTIKVNKYFKGEKNTAIITAVDNVDDLEINSFENGLFYLKKIENQNFYSVTIASVPTFGICNARDLIEISPVLPNEKSPRSTPVGPKSTDQCVPYYFEIDPDDLPFFYESPLKQIKSGISIHEIQCNDGLVQVIKNSDNSPACVTMQTKEKLIERGWAEPLGDVIFGRSVPAESPSIHESEMSFNYEIESNDVTYGSQYQITGGSVDEITYDSHSNSLIISLNESEKGHITIVIQTGLLHSFDQIPFTYFVIADGEEVVFEQLSPIVLKIQFEKGTRIIEIIGTFW